MITPETLTRHELVGLPVRVAAASNPDAVGIVGRVASESERTLLVRGPSGRAGRHGGADTRRATATDSVTESDARRPTRGASGVGVTGSVVDRRVPKRDATFEFALPADPSKTAVGWASVPPASGATDEAADHREGSGSTFELPWETPGTGATRPAGQSGGGEDVVYVTVDGERLLSRPAFRTERAGDSIWQSD